ncbi:MAG TPA: YbaB/EbfC family nucleoid-associated protein [Candidatus Saccharimonadales bacterium]|nr:YbaB/EbfC family nucleoid-associated protein [Candidatus Saccharimonadales bacterium]
MNKVEQARALLKAKKLQKELKNEIITTEQGDGAVKVEMTAEQKLKKVHIDASSVDLDDIGQLERWIEEAIKDAIQKSQVIAAEKMKPMMGLISQLGL